METVQLQQHYIPLTRQEALKLFQALGTVMRTVNRNGTRFNARDLLRDQNGDLYECFTQGAAGDLQICLL